MPGGLEGPRQRVLRVQSLQGEPEHRQRVSPRSGQGGTQEISLLFRKGMYGWFAGLYAFDSSENEVAQFCWSTSLAIVHTY